MSADTGSGQPGPDELLDGYVTAIQLVLSYLSQDGLPYHITSATVIDGLCLLVTEGLAQIGAAKSMLTMDQLNELHSGAVPVPDPGNFARAALEGLLSRLILQEAESGT